MKELVDLVDQIKDTNARITKVEGQVDVLGQRMLNTESNQAAIIRLIESQKKQREDDVKKFMKIDTRITDLHQTFNDQFTGIFGYLIDIKDKVDSKFPESKEDE